MKGARKKLGQRGEGLATAYLEQRDYAVRERNWRCPAGEVDILITGREAANPPLWDLSELGIRVVLT